MELCLLKRDPLPWPNDRTVGLLKLRLTFYAQDASGAGKIGILEHLKHFKMSRTSGSLFDRKNTVIPYHTSKCQLITPIKRQTKQTPKYPTKLAKEISYQHPESPNRIAGFCCTQVALLKDLVHILSRCGLAIDAVDLPARSVPVLPRFERDLQVLLIKLAWSVK